MSKYDVIVYPVVAVKIPGITASSPERAIKKAYAELADHGTTLDEVLKRSFRGGHPVAFMQSADSIDSYKVDLLREEGGIAETFDFTFDGKTPLMIGSEEVGEDEKYPMSAWREEVCAENPRLGYTEWVAHQKEARR